MNPTLTKIIESWIGTGEEIPRRYVLEFNDGYEEALSDLRARVPELVEKLESLHNEKVQFLSHNRSKSNYESIRDSLTSN